jgi:DUF3060 family protein
MCGAVRAGRVVGFPSGRDSMLRITLYAAMFVLVAATARADVLVHDDGVKLTVDCAKDKVVQISGDKVRIELTGTCDQVNISGDDGTLKGSVLNVNVSGDDNTLALEAVDSILVSGDRNTITYKKAAKAKKTGVLSSGKNNKISQVK